MKQTLCEWVIVVRDSAYHTYQILDERHEIKQPAWARLLRAVAKVGCNLYGIDLIR